MTVDNDLRLWHYTCEHSRSRIGEEGWLQPFASGLVWLTDLDVPVREALGLTSMLLTCDRTTYRYRVLDPSIGVPWTKVRRDFPAEHRDELESAPGAMPMHWFVSALPVHVVLENR